MDADGLFMGEATLRKILCLQETLRGVAGGAPLTESLLQVDRVLLRPSPLLQDKRLGCHPLRHRHSSTQAHTRTHSGTHTHPASHQSAPAWLIVCKQSGLMRRVKVNTRLTTSVFHVADTGVNEAGGGDGGRHRATAC